MAAKRDHIRYLRYIAVAFARMAAANVLVVCVRTFQYLMIVPCARCIAFLSGLFRTSLLPFPPIFIPFIGWYVSTKKGVLQDPGPAPQAGPPLGTTLLHKLAWS